MRLMAQAAVSFAVCRDLQQIKPTGTANIVKTATRCILSPFSLALDLLCCQQTLTDLQLQPAAFICLLPAGSCDVCNAETNTFLTDAAALTAPSTPQAGANNGQAIGKKPVRKRKEAPKNKGTKKKATRYESSSDEDSLELDNQQYTNARRGGRMQVDSEEEDEEGEVILAGGTKSRPVKTKQ